MKRITLLFVFLFLFSVIAIAQQKKYVSYTVKKGETVKSIAKTYHITSKDLLKLNPDMGKNIKENMVIIVPNLDFGKAEVKVTNGNKKTYFVLPKDTLYGISKMFGITIEQLVAANPHIAAGLEPGMELVIPGAGASIIQKNDSVNYEFHKVIKDDTMYNLSNRYNVSQSELLRLNPELSGGLKLGMLIKIKPIQKGAYEKNGTTEKDVVEVAGHFNEKLDFSKEIDLVILLPYQLSALSDSARIENFGKSNSVLNILTDFHLGASIAIDSLRNRGLK
ncbi:MAG: LysM peptidoglycan-binding domain-containing protein, partial [Lutibacter sp.]